MSPGSKIHADNVPKPVHQPNRRAPVLSTRNGNLHRLGEAIVDPIATTCYCSSPVVRGSSRGQASTQAACGPRVRRRQDGIKFQGDCIFNLQSTSVLLGCQNASSSDMGL